MSGSTLGEFEFELPSAFESLNITIFHLFESQREAVHMRDLPQVLRSLLNPLESSAYPHRVCSYLGEIKVAQ